MPKFEGDKADITALVGYAQSLEAETERLRAALEWIVKVRDSPDQTKKNIADYVSAVLIGADGATAYQKPVSLAGMRQTDEHRKSAEAKARLDAISGHQQQGDNK